MFILSDSEKKIKWILSNFHLIFSNIFIFFH